MRSYLAPSSLRPCGLADDGRRREPDQNVRHIRHLDARGQSRLRQRDGRPADTHVGLPAGGSRGGGGSSSGRDHAGLCALEPARRRQRPGAGPDGESGHGGGAAERNRDRGRPEQSEPGRRRGERLCDRTWSCTIGGTPCSTLRDAYSSTYFSNDGGQTWCCTSTDPAHIGTLIPGVERLVGGQYDAGGDPAVAFDSNGHVFYAGLGFNRTSAPNTVAVNKGTFSGGGNLSWGPPTFINQTTSPSILNDEEWIGVDWHVSSPFRDRVYVSWTRYIFNANNGSYVQSPIFFAYSTDGGATFSTPTNISGNVLYDQGSRPISATTERCT